MGSVSKYKTKDMVWVSAVIPSTGDPPVAGEPVKYAFPTNIPAADRTTLGQTALNYTTPPTQLVIGCSFPKPYRASQRQALRYTSSYCSKDKIAALKGAGWRVSPPRARPRIILGDKPFVQTVYVKIVGINYAWQIPKVTVTAATAAGITALGIINATVADGDDLVFGANFPKPPRASKDIAASGDDSGRRISTYYDPDKSPDGWTLRGGGRLKL